MRKEKAKIKMKIMMRMMRRRKKKMIFHLKVIMQILYKNKHSFKARYLKDWEENKFRM
jgi:hypothetical protein